MVIVFVLLLWVIWLTMALALYANFLPYFSLLRDIKDYNMAYYGANTAIERSLLVLRQQDPWFEAKGWWNAQQIFDVASDNSLTGFSYFNTTNYINRSIVSRATNTIPTIGMWNSNIYNLSTWGTSYNILTYGQTQTIPLQIDSTIPKNSYLGTDTTISKFYGHTIALQLKLPTDIRNELINQWLTTGDTSLCITCDTDGDGMPDDAIVGWSLEGIYDGGTEQYNFSILPRNLIGRPTTGSTELIVFSDDETIRETDIIAMTDDNKSINFSDNINPLFSSSLANTLRASQKTWHLLIGSDALFSGVRLNEYTFSDLMGTTVDKVRNLELKLSLNNKLISNSTQIYPFLEYKVTANVVWVAQPFFYVQGEAKVGSYTVKMNIIKPIDKKNIIDSFTVIF